jgi:hypothetical protein
VSATKIAMTELATEVLNTNGDRPAPERRRRRAVRPTSGFVQFARSVAVVVTVVIAVVAFTLSFSTLSALARSAGYGHLAWLWPVCVDGSIVQSTIAILSLASFPSQYRNRLFLWGVLAVSAGVSISGNILYAVLVAHEQLPAAVAAVIATVPPAALLASTHSVAILAKFRAPAPRKEGI